MLHVNIKCMSHHTIRIGHGIVAFFPWRNFGGQRAGYFHLPMELSQVDRLLLKEMLKSWYSQHLRPQETKRKKTMETHGWKDGNQTNLLLGKSCWTFLDIIIMPCILYYMCIYITCTLCHRDIFVYMMYINAYTSSTCMVDLANL